MHHSYKHCIAAALCAAYLGIAPAKADVKLPAVLGSHMVLQQNMPLPVWGWADAGEKVTVVFDEQKASATADAEGRWKVLLQPVKADGKVHTMSISGKNAITLDNLLIGEVWIGSGQSNMARSLGKESTAATQPQIRLLQVPAVQSKKPLADVNAAWKTCTPEDAAGFSAVLYYFGQRLHDELKVPIGLINMSRGSTAIEQFLPKSGVLYNGSMVPLQPIAMRGIIWYQGEANVANGLDYAPKLKSMIEGWRKDWDREFPFYIVQIAPLQNYKPDLLPPLWEAQMMALHLPKTGVVVITDLVDSLSNIHPRNKKDVGYRLALWALAKDYDRKEVVFSGPIYQSMKVENNKIRLSFAHAKGLKARDAKARKRIPDRGR